MRSPRAAKWSTWVALVMILLGGSLLVVPRSGALVASDETSGNLTCEQIVVGMGLTDVFGVKDDGNRSAPYPSDGSSFVELKGSDLTVWYRFVPATEGYVVDFKDASAKIYGVYVKQASASQDRSVLKQFPGGTYSGSVAYPEDNFSHISFCSGTPGQTPQTATLEVVKVVAGNNAPSDWSFAFTGVGEGFTLTDEKTTTGAMAVQPGTSYTVTETSTQGASASVACVGAAGTPVVDGAAVTLSVAAGGHARCTFTNTFTRQETIPPQTVPPETVPPVVEPASLQIVKRVVGGVPDDWTVGFAGDLGAFQVSDVVGSHTVTGLDPGTYEVSEVVPARSTLLDIECTDPDAVVDLDDATVSATLSAGEAATCTFTNSYPEVQPDEVTSTTTTTTVVPVTPDTTPTVLPEVVVRPELPRTGQSTGWLAMLGLGLVLTGAALLGANRKVLGRRA